MKEIKKKINKPKITTIPRVSPMCYFGFSPQEPVIPVEIPIVHK